MNRLSAPADPPLSLTHRGRTRGAGTARPREGTTEMRSTIATAALALLGWVCAAPAHAEAPATARDIQAAVDGYLESGGGEAGLVGGPGSVGYDQGFWIRGGDFSLQVNLTLQARYEAWLWDADAKPALPAGSGGSLSGFALPRATLKLSGSVPCNISYYLELEFGHFGQDVVDAASGGAVVAGLGPQVQSLNFDTAREAWIQWSAGEGLHVRLGQVRTATTRQAMVGPERQQFVDVSLASAFVGWTMPGYTDRNRDHGLALHGALGCKNEWSYLVTVTNGDGGDSIRNVLDARTSDNLAYSARLNWAFLDPVGYQEGALRNQTCRWYGEIGAWGWSYADRVDRPHVQVADALRYGLDLALGYGGWSLSAAWNAGSDEVAGGPTVDYRAYLVQLGYHFPGTAWEVAARWDGYDSDNPAGVAAPQQVPMGNGRVSEFAFAVNYYLNGHGNKLSLDASWVSGADTGSALLFDPLAGYPAPGTGAAAQGDDAYGVLFRFQWQLAL